MAKEVGNKKRTKQNKGKKEPQIETIRRQAMKDISKATDKTIEEVRVSYLGRKGTITSILKDIKNLEPAKRPAIGQKANKLRQDIEKAIKTRIQTISVDTYILPDEIDVSLPGRKVHLGSKHVITQIIEEIVGIFGELGYSMVETGEVETAYYNFMALNTPLDHPACTLQATFYIDRDVKDEKEKVLLRTHTSPAQIRVMKEKKPPLYVIVPGKVYRPDVPDPTHSPMFHQVEGFAIDKDITFGDLKGTLEVFCEKMFGAGRKVRFRPHYFPFTEPSAEVDVSCIRCGGEGCRVCSQTGWLEILGAGIIDPNVLEEVGYDPDDLTGFAFGMAPDRIAMLKYDISDIRMFFENDIRFLEQF